MVFARTPAFCLTSRRARSLTSSLFDVTFLACLLTVSASHILSCPAHPQHGRFADGDEGVESQRKRAAVTEKRPKGWIEERHPGSHDT